MSLPLILGALWVLAATITALLPMRRQYIPGVTLLILAPPLIVWIGWQHGLVWLLLALFALLSMFRRPLLYFARKGLGLPVTLPTELDKDRA
ncbi:MAG: DUF2484 family protein [Paracoccaceae bacterium]